MFIANKELLTLHTMRLVENEMESVKLLGFVAPISLRCWQGKTSSSMAETKVGQNH